VTSGAATFDRPHKLLEFDRNVHIVKSGQIIEADAAVAHLSDDEQRIESLELHNNARIMGSAGGPGSLRGLKSADMTLTYGPDGQSLQRALMVGQALLEMAGELGSPGRQIAAQTLDIAMAPDGVTPAALTGRDSVQLTFPAEADVPARTIRAAQIDSTGEGGHGLTRAQFTGGVQFRERGAQIDRAARSNQLDVTMQPGMAAIDEARFVHAVQFEDGTLAALAAAGRYDTAKGSLELTGSEPGFLTPRTVNDRIAVDATRIDIVLDGPQVDAAGTVKSTLQPAKASGHDPGSAPATGSSDPKLPSMLKQDQPVTVLADKLRYDGKSSMATYTGSARLFQVDTTIKGDLMVIDEQKGDLGASGHVMTTTIRDATKEGGNPKDPKDPKDPKKPQDAKDPDKKPDRQQTIGTSTDMAYVDATRTLIYTGVAHLVGPAGDLSAERIDLFLNPSGDDVDRAEGYAAPDKTLTLHETNRTTTGARLTYTAANETYVVTGLPATLVDECARETIGKTLTWLRYTDTIVVDGNQQVRTHTKSTGRCP
jgi:lipopolysaccharide export system protein LptA